MDGAAGHARIPPGGSWTDPDWGGGVSALVRDFASPYRTQLAWPNVRWRRPAEIVPDELQLAIQLLHEHRHRLLTAGLAPAVKALLLSCPHALYALLGSLSEQSAK